MFVLAVEFTREEMQEWDILLISNPPPNQRVCAKICAKFPSTHEVKTTNNLFHPVFVTCHTLLWYRVQSQLHNSALLSIRYMASSSKILIDYCPFSVMASSSQAFILANKVKSKYTAHEECRIKNQLHEYSLHKLSNQGSNRMAITIQRRDH